MDNWLGSTNDLDQQLTKIKKIHWDWQSTWINNWLGLTVNYCSTFTDPFQHIYCIIAVCFKHYCSTYMVPFEHIYNTIAAHLLHHCSTFNYSNIAEYKIQIIYLGGKLLYWCYLFEGLIENGKVKESCITWHDLLQPMRYPTCDEMIKIDHVKYCEIHF